MDKFLLVFAGGGIGSYLRYLITQWSLDRFGLVFPLGTLFANIGGCFAAGLIAGLPMAAGSLSPTTRLLLMTGFLGGLTTFSSYEYESFMLLQNGAIIRALLNLGGGIIAGLAALTLGFVLSRSLAKWVIS